MRLIRLGLLGIVLFGQARCGQTTRLTSEKYGATSIEYANSILAYPGTEGAAFSSSIDDAGTRFRVICALPPSQAARELDRLLSLQGSVNANQQAEGAVAQALAREAARSDGDPESSESAKRSASNNLSAKAAQALLLSAELESRRTERIVRVFEQSERTLFLQFSQYRLCEAFNNGMLKSTPQTARRRATAMYLEADKFISKLLQSRQDALRQAVEENRRQQVSLDRARDQLQEKIDELKKLQGKEPDPKLRALESERKKLDFEQSVLEKEAPELNRNLSQFDSLGLRQGMLEPYRHLLDVPVDGGVAEDPYEVAFENILTVARLMAEERPVLEAQLATSQAEAKAKEAAEAAAKAAEKAKAAEAKVSSLEKELKESSEKAAQAAREKAEAELKAYKACTESKTCTPK